MDVRLRVLLGWTRACKRTSDDGSAIRCVR